MIISCENAAWIEEMVEMDTEASECDSDSETSSESQTSTCSDQSNNSNQSNHSSCTIDDGESCKIFCGMKVISTFSTLCLHFFFLKLL